MDYKLSLEKVSKMYKESFMIYETPGQKAAREKENLIRNQIGINELPVPAPKSRLDNIFPTGMQLMSQVPPNTPGYYDKKRKKFV